MTTERLAELEALARGEWPSVTGGIAKCCTAIPELIAALREERQQRLAHLETIRAGGERELLLDAWWTQAVVQRDALEARVKELQAAGDAMRRMWAEDNSDAAKE